MQPASAVLTQDEIITIMETPMLQFPSWNAPVLSAQILQFSGGYENAPSSSTARSSNPTSASVVPRKRKIPAMQLSECTSGLPNLLRWAQHVSSDPIIEQMSSAHPSPLIHAAAWWKDAGHRALLGFFTFAMALGHGRKATQACEGRSRLSTCHQGDGMSAVPSP